MTLREQTRLRSAFAAGALALALLGGSCATAGSLPGVSGKALQVGPGKQFATPSAAARAAANGDIIEIDAGVYDGDVAVWRQNNLVIRGVGGRAHLRANGKDAEGKGIWVIKGANTTLEHIEFSGARVSDTNGAGIRQEGPNLTLRDCYFHDNENGILTSRDLSSEILIERSEFAHNGHGDGMSHNLYIGAVKRLTLRQVYSHHANVGHNLKSRAAQTEVFDSRIADEADGYASYAIDCPNGGVVKIVGNVIQQGPRTENSTLIAYGKEGLRHADNQILIEDNTLINDRPDGGVFIFVAPGTTKAVIEKNVLAGPGTALVGTAVEKDNRTIADPNGVDRTHAPDGKQVGLPQRVAAE